MTLFSSKKELSKIFYTEGLKGQADHGQLEKFSDP